MNTERMKYYKGAYEALVKSYNALTVLAKDEQEPNTADKLEDIIYDLGELLIKAEEFMES